MTIATQDGALAGMQIPRYFAKAATPTLVAGRPHSLWYLGGSPGAGSMDNSTSGGVALSMTSALVNGQIPRANPSAGKAYLARLSAAASQPGMLLLCDRLWHGSALVSGAVMSVTSTSSQTLTSFPALPARDVNASVNGEGVHMGLEVYSAMGSGTPTINLGYTNSGGTTGRTAALIDSVVASSAIGAFYRFGLQSGDVGVKAATSIQLSATMTSGNFGLVAYRVLAALELAAANVGNAIDSITGGFPVIPDGAVPFFLFIPNTTTAANISGTYIESQG